MFAEQYEVEGKTTYPTKVVEIKVVEEAYNHINKVLNHHQAWYTLLEWFGLHSEDVLPSAVNTNLSIEAETVKYIFRTFENFPLPCMQFPAKPSSK